MPETDKIAFLDIDGVMIPAGESEFSTDAVRACTLLRRNGYKIVLSSTWRARPGRLREAYRMFDIWGIPVYGNVGAKTASKVAACVEFLDDWYGPEWPEKILLIDDYPIIRTHYFQTILISSTKGLTPADIAGYVEKEEENA